MNNVRFLILVAVFSLGTLGRAQFSNTGAFAYSSGGFAGQSFTTPNDGTADLMTGFTWLDLSNAPIGTGSLYLFGQEYLGTPTNIASGPGLLATSATYLAGEYSFNSGVLLAAGTQYWVYTSTSQQVGATAGGYAGGTFYQANNSGVNFASSSLDATFSVTATAVPEPSTYAALAGAGALGLAVWRRRQTQRLTPQSR